MSEYVRRNYDDVLRANSALLIRAEAAEARCAELEGEWDVGFTEGLRAMRERAAKLINDFADDIAGDSLQVHVGDYRYLATRIRALPLDQTQKGQPPDKG